MELTATKPKARREGLSVTVAGTETLVYDPEQFMIHRLGTATATIWQLADGTRDILALTTDVQNELDRPINRRAVEDSLRELAEMGLIDDVPAEKRKMSRRMLVGGALGVAAASSYIPVSAASVLTCIERWGGAEAIASFTAWCESIGGTAWWESLDPCKYSCEIPNEDPVGGTSPELMRIQMQLFEEQELETVMTEEAEVQPMGIDTPFDEEPTQEPTEAPTESPTSEGVVDALSEPVPNETVPPAEPVTVETVPPGEPEVTTQGDAQPAPVVEEPAPVVPTPTPVPTEVPPPPPVQEPEPVPAAPNVDTSIEVEVVIDD